MGQSDSKIKIYEDALQLFSGEEKFKIRALYSKLAGRENKLSSTNFLSYVIEKVGFPEFLSKSLLSFMKNSMGHNLAQDSVLSVEHFTVGLSKILKCDTDMKAELIFNLSTQNTSHTESVHVKLMCQFFEAVINVCITLLASGSAGKSWCQINVTSDQVQQFVWNLLRHINTDCEGRTVDSCEQKLCTNYDITVWLTKNRLIDAMLEFVFYSAFPICEAPVSPLLPIVEADAAKSSILNPLLVTYINFHLPQPYRSHWQLLFSSRKHGESFARLIKQISGKGPNIILIRDSDGYIFGGFASVAWELNAKFFGTEQCFLFTLLPQLSVYYASGLNKNFLYLNYGQETLPNGLGMGGQHGYHGLWLDPEYGSGHSRARTQCSTYESPQLSKKEDFTIIDVEVWAVNPPKKKDGLGSDSSPEASPKSKKHEVKSILDKDPTATAMLEMAGKKINSDGLRDVDSK